ncbi:MAG: PAS domain S-box protein [Mariprofundaceae bacterium]
MRKLSTFIPILAVIFGVMLSVGAVFSAYQYLILQEKEKFISESNRARDHIQAQIHSVKVALGGLEAVAYASREMSARKLNIVAKQHSKSPVNAMFYAPLVQQNDRASFEAMMQDSGYISFAIKQNASMPSSIQSSYFPITFIEPFEVDNAWLIGLDLLTSNFTRNHINDAILTDKTVPVFTNDLQENTEKADLWLFKALYSGRLGSIDHIQSGKSNVNAVIGMKISTEKIFTTMPLSTNTSVTISAKEHSGALTQLQQRVNTSSNLFTSYDKHYEIPFGEHTIILNMTKSLSWTNNIFIILLVGLILGLLATTALAITVKALLESEARQHAIIQSALDAIITIDEHDLVQAFNPAAEKIFGYSVKEAMGRSISKLIIPKDQLAGHHAGMAAYLQTGKRKLMGEMREVMAVRANGEEFPIELTLTEINVKGQRLFTAFIYDISKRKEAERKVNQLATVVEQADLVVVLTDCDGIIQYVNSAFETISGYAYDEAIGQRPSIVKSGNHSAEYYKEMWQTLLAGKSWIGEFKNKSKTGSIYEVMQTVFPIFEPQSKLITGFASIQRDITESKRLEQQTEHAQRLESLGVMAGGIAHDFNNLLAAIMGNAGLALKKMDADSPTSRYLHNINNASESAALLCKQMLAYSGQGQFISASINISAMIQDITQLLNTSISKKAELGLALQEDLPAIQGDPGQIQQVVMNLVINASEALEDSAGHISASTKTILLAEKDLIDLLGADYMQAGEHVVLTVRDTGCGMSPETQQKIFEPFFTTKFTGRGLGMSALLGIIRSHHGGIKLTSHLGQGTEFNVYLPVCAESEPITSAHSSTNMQAAVNIPGVVLIVDDEEAIREMCVDILTDENLPILTACDGEEAVSIFREQHENIALVILDMTMPKMDGVEAARNMFEISPTTKVIISSGYSEDDISKQFEGKNIFGFVQKPYAPDALIKKVIHALSEPL